MFDVQLILIFGALLVGLSAGGLVCSVVRCDGGIVPP